jgi:CRP-like cAMP-binding protein
VENPFVRKMERHVRLAPEDRAILDGLARQHIRHVAGRQDIEGPHTEPYHTHLILDGWACRYKQFPDGRRAIVALLLPGDLCDPFAFRRGRMDHAIGALTPVTVARITPDQIGDAVRGRPAIAARRSSGWRTCSASCTCASPGRAWRTGPRCRCR